MFNDLRFKNELECLQEFSNVVTVRIKRKVDCVKLTHESEVGLKDVLDEQFDYVIKNDGKISDLTYIIDDIITKHGDVV